MAAAGVVVDVGVAAAADVVVIVAAVDNDSNPKVPNWWPYPYWTWRPN